MAEYTIDVWGRGSWSGIVEADSEEEAQELAIESALMEGLENTEEVTEVEVIGGGE